MDVPGFFKSEFAEHHAVARASEAALAGAFAGLLAACVAADDRAGGWQAAQRLLDMSGGARVWAAEARRRHTEFATPAQPR